MDTNQPKKKKAKHYMDWKLDDSVIQDIAERHRERQYQIMKDYKFVGKKTPIH